jgi:hypothetical protein
MKEYERTRLQEALNLIQEARSLNLQGEYGKQDSEPVDVRLAFDRAVELITEVVIFAE